MSLEVSLTPRSGLPPAPDGGEAEPGRQSRQRRGLFYEAGGRGGLACGQDMRYQGEERENGHFHHPVIYSYGDLQLPFLKQ